MTMLAITRLDLENIFRHCDREYPNEACGILAGKNGRVTRAYAVKNAKPGPARYEMDPEEQFRVMKAIREEGLAMVGIYHSHPSGPAFPSGIDVDQAYWPGTLYPNYPDAVYVIVSLLDRQRPAARGFTILERKVSEVQLAVVAGER